MISQLAAGFVYAPPVGTAAGPTLDTSSSRSERPTAALVFIGSLGIFVVGLFAISIPAGLSLQTVLLAIPLILLLGLLGVGIWMRSRLAWAANVWIWAAVLFNAIRWQMLGPFDSTVSWSNFNLLRLCAAVVLLSVLVTPSLFRWIWRNQPTP